VVELDGFLNTDWADNRRILRMKPEKQKKISCWFDPHDPAFIRAIRISKPSIRTSRDRRGATTIDKMAVTGERLCP
jgi:hypothetical protein